MKTKNAKKDNFLDYIPEYCEGIELIQEECQEVILVKRKNRLLSKYREKDRAGRIELDSLGGYVCKNIDGKHSVFEIAQQLENEFGEKAEPLYQRLILFLKILNQKNLIKYKNIKCQ